MWKQVRIWILSSWSFLTIGILLGSWWAYHELGWGGWWFWDPVENASLMPWLVATACIHSITKPKLNYWTLICAQATFILSILGTFFVRSGLLSSVHSFATDSTRGVYLLFFLLSIIAISILNWRDFGAIQGASTASGSTSGRLWRRDRRQRSHTPYERSEAMQGPTLEGGAASEQYEGRLWRRDEGAARLWRRDEGPTKEAYSERASKARERSSSLEQILLLQNFYFCVICIVVLFGTAAPLLFHWIWNRDVSTGAPFYNGTLIPLFTSLFFILLYVHYIQFNISNKESQLRSAPILYCIFLFFVHIFIGAERIGLNFLDSIYAAICVLLISSIIISLGSLAPARIETIRSYASKQYKARLWRRDEGATLEREAGARETNRERYQFEASERTRKNNSKQEMNIAHTGIVFFISGILLSNTFKFEFTEQLHSGPLGIRLGSQICCLRSIDHSFAPTFHSICANLLVLQQTNYPNNLIFQKKNDCPYESKPEGDLLQIWFQKLVCPRSRPPALTLIKYPDNSLEPKIKAPQSLSENQLCVSLQSRACIPPKSGLGRALYGYEYASFVGPSEPSRAFAVCMFPEKRFYYSNQGTVATKVAIHSNLFTDFYSLIGTGSIETGWFTTIMKLPFIFCIWLGFIFGVIGGFLSLKKQIQKSKLYWI